MSVLPPAVRHTPQQIPRRPRSHRLDRPTSLSLPEPQPPLDDSREVTGEGTAGRTVGGHSGSGVEGYAMRPRIPPQEHRAGLGRDAQQWTHGEQVSPWGLAHGMPCDRFVPTSMPGSWRKAGNAVSVGLIYRVIMCASRARDLG